MKKPNITMCLPISEVFYSHIEKQHVFVLKFWNSNLKPKVFEQGIEQ